MYEKAGTVAAAGTTGTLAMTGANVLWLALAGFALLAAASAVMRISPRMRRADRA